MTDTRKPGRPPKNVEKLGDYIGLRAPRDLKAKLEAAAVASGRSLSTEAQFRLERSFEAQDTGRALTALFYGTELAGLTQLVAHVMLEAGYQAALDDARNSRKAIETFLDNPFAYSKALEAAILVLQAFRPMGGIVKNPSAPDDVAERAAFDTLDMLIQSDAAGATGQRMMYHRGMMGSLFRRLTAERIEEARSKTP